MNLSKIVDYLSHKGLSTYTVDLSGNILFNAFYNDGQIVIEQTDKHYCIVLYLYRGATTTVRLKRSVTNQQLINRTLITLRG